MRLTTPHIALTIAGFDPSSGAGITADLKTFAAHEVFGVACITATTIQSTMGVRSVHPQSADQIRQTLDCLAEDIEIAGVKIGMLGSYAAAREVSRFLGSQPPGPARSRIVLDPVIRSTSGAALIDANGAEVIREELLQQVGWVTPNREELAILVGDDPGDAARWEPRQVVAAAKRLQALVARNDNDGLNLVVTGGDADLPVDFLLTAAGEQHWLVGEKVLTTATHGTGCAFSSALLCGLIVDLDPQAAAASAKSYVTEALRSAYPIGKGKGPMNHLFSLSSTLNR